MRKELTESPEPVQAKDRGGKEEARCKQTTSKEEPSLPQDCRGTKRPKCKESDARDDGPLTKLQANSRKPRHAGLCSNATEPTSAKPDNDMAGSGRASDRDGISDPADTPSAANSAASGRMGLLRNTKEPTPTKFKADAQGSIRAELRGDGVSPMLAASRTNGIAPEVLAPVTNTAAPERHKLRTGITLAKCATASTKIAEPRRAGLRGEMAGPSCDASTGGAESPKRPMPHRGAGELKRPEVRRKGAGPVWLKETAEGDEPKQIKLRKERERPNGTL